MALLVVLGVMLTAQVIMRFGFGLGYSWIEEITRMLFVWVIFLGAVAAMRRNLHIRVEAGLLLFPQPLRPLAGWLGDLALFAFCLADDVARHRARRVDARRELPPSVDRRVDVLAVHDHSHQLRTAGAASRAMALRPAREPAS